MLLYMFTDINHAQNCDDDSNEVNNSNEEINEKADGKESTPYHGGLNTIKTNVVNDMQDDEEEEQVMKDMIGEEQHVEYQK